MVLGLVGYIFRQKLTQWWLQIKKSAGLESRDSARDPTRARDLARDQPRDLSHGFTDVPLTTDDYQVANETGHVQGHVHHHVTSHVADPMDTLPPMIRRQTSLNSSPFRRNRSIVEEYKARYGKKKLARLTPDGGSQDSSQSGDVRVDVRPSKGHVVSSGNGHISSVGQYLDSEYCEPPGAGGDQLGPGHAGTHSGPNSGPDSGLEKSLTDTIQEKFNDVRDYFREKFGKTRSESPKMAMGYSSDTTLKRLATSRDPTSPGVQIILPSTSKRKAETETEKSMSSRGSKRKSRRSRDGQLTDDDFDDGDWGDEEFDDDLGDTDSGDLTEDSHGASRDGRRVSRAQSRESHVKFDSRDRHEAKVDSRGKTNLGSRDGHEQSVKSRDEPNFGSHDAKLSNLGSRDSHEARGGHEPRDGHELQETAVQLRHGRQVALAQGEHYVEARQKPVAVKRESLKAATNHGDNCGEPIYDDIVVVVGGDK